MRIKQLVDAAVEAAAKDATAGSAMKVFIADREGELEEAEMAGPEWVHRSYVNTWIAADSADHLDEVCVDGCNPVLAMVVGTRKARWS
jgi:hypothetical protein